MTYLGWPRLHFSGRYLADPSTVNNSAGNRENPAVEEPGAGLAPSWNPNGTHAFAFEDVQVRAAIGSEGAPAGADPVIGTRLASAGALDAKIVDLDTDQQTVSMIYGLDLALFDDDENILFRGQMDPVPFTDLWSRIAENPSDMTSTAAYHSTLVVQEWGDLSGSPFLRQLHDAAGDGLLSIKFNIDQYSSRPPTPAVPNPAFRRGRVVGTIGAAATAEPRQQILGRQFGTMPSAAPGVVNFFPGVLDEPARTVRLDLGNALPAVDPASLDLTLGYRDENGAPVRLGPIDTGTPDWYATTAGVVDVPVTDTQAELVRTHQLVILTGPDGAASVLVEEAPVHVRAAEFVTRLEPGDSWMVRFHATDRGEPHKQKQIALSLRVPRDPNGNPIADYPVHGLTFPPSVTTTDDGIAEVTFTAADPGGVRYYRNGATRDLADGQVYRVSYAVEGAGSANPSNFLSVLVFTTYDGDATWNGGLGDVLAQYGNLYPVMSRADGPHIDLTDCESVAAHHKAILETLMLDVTDPRYMPVTRDLSESRRQALITWLTVLGPGGRPVCDTTGPDRAVAASSFIRESVDPDADAEAAAVGSKTAAARREGIAPTP